MQPLISTPSHFSIFAHLLSLESPASDPSFEKLPDIMQMILENPDSVQSIENLIQMQTEEEYYAPIIELLIADIFHRNSTNVKFDFPEAVLRAVGRTDYLSGHAKKSNRSPIENKNGLEEAEDIFIKKDDLIDEPSWNTPILNMVCNHAT